MMKRYVVVMGIFALSLLSGMTSNVSLGEETLCGFVYSYWDNVEGCQFVPMELCEGGIVYLDDPPESYLGYYMKFINPKWMSVRCESGGEVRVMWDAKEAYYISSCAECGSPEECEEWLIVKCNIAGYELYIDGNYELTEDGDGECGIKLEAGTYSVKLKKDGCDTITKTARIECGHSTTIHVTMDCYEDCNNGRDDDGDGKIDCDDSDCRQHSDCDPCRRDSDSDGIKDCDDDCPHEKENYDGYQDGDGCPDVVPNEDCNNGRDDDGDGKIDCDDSDCDCSKKECENTLLWIHCNIYEYDLYVDGEYRLTESGGPADRASSTTSDGICGVPLPAGKHTIQLKKYGCETVEETVFLSCEEDTTIYLNMRCRVSERTRFRIVFVPGGWDGNHESYENEARTQYDHFFEYSHIENFLNPDVVFWDEADMGPLGCPPFIWETWYHLKFLRFRSREQVPEGDVYVVLINEKECCGNGLGFRLPRSNVAYCSTGKSFTVAHEIGHILGLDDHEGKCIMSSNHWDYCTTCSKELDRKLQEIAEEKRNQSIGFLMFVPSLLPLVLLLGKRVDRGPGDFLHR
ncbi:MAG: hypothetical protein HXS43_06240 [Theionarchaea archaeon]|nr:hypothetical protein [Theionarchaea archaeon]